MMYTECLGEKPVISQRLRYKKNSDRKSISYSLPLCIRLFFSYEKKHFPAAAICG
jgi:hypothetical protein